MKSVYWIHKIIMSKLWTSEPVMMKKKKMKKKRENDFLTADPSSVPLWTKEPTKRVKMSPSPSGWLSRSRTASGNNKPKSLHWHSINMNVKTDFFKQSGAELRGSDVPNWLNLVSSHQKSAVIWGRPEITNWPEETSFTLLNWRITR